MRLALAKLLLRSELRGLERKIHPVFDRALSLRIDAVRVALEVLE